MGASAPVDSRASCPACGGQVHPVAGRCKHCKADLARLRAGTSSAAPRAPAKVATLADLKPMTPPPLGGGNGHHAGNGASSGALPLGVAPPSPYAAGAPAAPAPEAAAEPRRWSTLWPLIVAVIAICAIVASVAMLLFGGDGGKKSSKAKRFEGPAPELTPTDPGAHQVVPPGGDPPMPAPSMPDPTAPPPAAGIAPSAAGPRDVEEFVGEALDVGCRRMTTCQGSDPKIASDCQMARSMVSQLGDTLKTACQDFDGRAGRACIDSIGRLPCPGSDVDTNQLALTLLNLSDCQKVCPDFFGDFGGGGGFDQPDLPADPRDNPLFVPLDDDPVDPDGI